MCLSCGCNEPNDDHGDKRNITMKSLEDAAKAGEVGSTSEVVNNIQSGFESGGGAQKQMAGAGTRGQTGGNQQSVEGRQSGYGSSSSSGPQ
jgi:hypothetical protein